MDVLTITVIATLILAAAVPVDTWVAFRFYRAWKGGEHILYFAPLLAVIVTTAIAAAAYLFVGLSAVQLRFTGFGIVPPGVGLLIIALAALAPSAALVWLWWLLRRQES